MEKFRVCAPAGCEHPRAESFQPECCARSPRLGEEAPRPSQPQTGNHDPDLDFSYTIGSDISTSSFTALPLRAASETSWAGVSEARSEKLLDLFSWCSRAAALKEV